MKKQLLKATLLKAGKFFCIFLLGSAVGVVSMWQYTLHFGMQHDDGTGSSRLITDKIAIVNLDEGIPYTMKKSIMLKNLSLIWMIISFLRVWKMQGKGTQPVSMPAI